MDLQPQAPAERPRDAPARARRLYACARHIEENSASATVQEAAREVALLALDLLAEERARKSA